MISRITGDLLRYCGSSRTPGETEKQTYLMMIGSEKNNMAILLDLFSSHGLADWFYADWTDITKIDWGHENAGSLPYLFLSYRVTLTTARQLCVFRCW